MAIAKLALKRGESGYAFFEDWGPTALHVPPPTADPDIEARIG